MTPEHQVAEERRSFDDALAWRSLHDVLTELPNRTLLIDHLERAICRARRSGRETALLVVDLDDFDMVNRRIGKLAGDAVLKAVAELLRGVLDPGDMVARVGGDEFAICCDLADGAAAYAVADRLARVLSVPFRTGTETFVVTASIGIALCGSKVRAEDLLRRASVAMFSAKQAGVGRVQMFDDADHDQLRRRHELAADLEEGLAAGDVQTYFQPEVALESGELVGFEALARWRHPTRGIIDPAVFVPVAEESGLIDQLGAEMLRQACRALASWMRDTPGRPLTVAVNVSARQLADRDFPDTVRAILVAEGVPAGQVCLEVTESALVDSDVVSTAVHALKSLGVMISIDDFGTGYSSLSRLHHFPVDDLKVDLSFVAGMVSRREDAAIVSALVGLGRALGIRTIAEGIERTDQLHRLRDLGCDVGQGFLWSEAVPAQEAARMARTWRPFPDVDLGVDAADASPNSALRGLQRNMPAPRRNDRPTRLRGVQLDPEVPLAEPDRSGDPERLPPRSPTTSPSFIRSPIRPRRTPAFASSANLRRATSFARAQPVGDGPQLGDLEFRRRAKAD